jgi:hypothetical protein
MIEYSRSSASFLTRFWACKVLVTGWSIDELVETFPLVPTPPSSRERMDSHHVAIVARSAPRRIDIDPTCFCSIAQMQKLFYCPFLNFPDRKPQTSGVLSGTTVGVLPSGAPGVHQDHTKASLLQAPAGSSSGLRHSQFPHGLLRGRDLWRTPSCQVLLPLPPLVKFSSVAPKIQ